MRSYLFISILLLAEILNAQKSRIRIIFSALAAGYTYYGTSTNKGKFGHFWTSSPSGSPGNPWLCGIRHDYSNPVRGYFLDENGRSVRCIKN